MAVDPKDWITAAAVPDLGAVTLKRLWEAGWTPEKLLTADETAWQRLGLKPKTMHALSRLRRGKDAAICKKVESALHWQEDTADAVILSITDPHYPNLLREISDPPPVLFCRGCLNALSTPQLAIVGSRNASASGLRHAYAFSAYLAQQGLAITSGLALGIDAQAHLGAVDHAGVTVAVLGTGADRIYPSRNIQLAERILAQQGVLVSEYFPGTPPLAANFPKRNRIISGLSAGVLVVEAALKSGSLITARMALEHNRDVFALPGPLNNPMSRGCHKLIKDGAVLVETAEDIIAEIGHILSVFGSESMVRGGLNEKSLTEALSAPESVVLNCMGYEVISLDQLAVSAAMAVYELSPILVEMELKGLITQESGGYIRL